MNRGLGRRARSRTVEVERVDRPDPGTHAALEVRGAMAKRSGLSQTR